jgi:phage/plasmid-associated DNA primase
MPDVKTKAELSRQAVALAQSFSCVMHGGLLYIPADFETGDTTITPPVERKVWLPFTREEVQKKAQEQFDTLFHNDAELTNFEFMVKQCAISSDTGSSSLMIKTNEGLKELKEDGKLYDPSGEFVANALPVTLNESVEDKAELMSIISEWLNSEEEALALLKHLATALAPSWSAVRYVILLGDGRNGKSVLLSMLERVLGRHNCSNVTRQDIAAASPVVTELRNKLANIVFDGQAVYLKDSGMEKTLVAGEQVGIRRLYSSELTPVKTNALFIEGLNKEPKSVDKSTALQARLMRFWFPNTYPDDLLFMERMTSDRYVGALLALMIDNYVLQSNKSVLLAPTAQSRELQLDHLYANSLAIQFIEYIELNAALMSEILVGMDTSELTQRFNAWQLSNGELKAWLEPDVVNLFRPVVNIDRRSKRINGMPRKVRAITGFKEEAKLFIDRMRGDANADTLVEE